MAYWLGEFRHAFLTEWERAGLAPPDPDPMAYAPTPVDAPEVPPLVRLGDDGVTLPVALSDDVVESVSRFGRDFGEICALMVGADLEESEELSDWCGRFNLGISLFDFVCDELPDQIPAMLNAPAFASFSRRPAAPESEITDPVVRALNEIAMDLLADLATRIGPMTSSSRRSGIWRALDSMFAAQLDLSLHGANRTPNDQLLNMMRLKSSEPFRVMAQFVGRGVGVAPGRVRQLGNFGRAAGDCFWIVDDAVDVWSDLDRGHTNYFLSMALTVDPSLDLTSLSPVLDARLGRIWRVSQLPDRISRRMSSAVAAALARFDGAPSDMVSRRLATMIASWLS